MEKLFVWDFHGVLEKGNEAAVRDITNFVLKKYGYSARLSSLKCHKYYGLKWYQYFEKLLPNEPAARHLELQLACRTYQQSHPLSVQKHIKTNDFALTVIKKIAVNHDQIIISNSHPDSLKFFLRLVKLQKYFPSGKAFGANSHENPTITKKTHLLDYLQGKNFEKIIYIGDSPEDIELASLTGGTTYLYAHPGNLHKRAQANYKINDLREVLKEV